MNSKKYVSALIQYHKGSHLSADDEVLITVIGPAAGILLGAGIEVLGSYLKRRKQNRLNSPGIIPVTVNSNGNNSKLFRRTLHRVKPILALPSVISQLISSQILRIRVSGSFKVVDIIVIQILTSETLKILISSSFKVIDVIIIFRSVILVRNLLNHLISTRENVFRMTVNTLCWIIYSRERDKMVHLAFALVAILSAKLWSTKNRLTRRLLRIWVCITFLNLSNYIYVSPTLLRPSNIGVFGLPRVEHQIKQLDAFSENTTNSKISMLGKEEPLGLPLSLQKEMPKGISNNPELEMNKMMQNSTLGEEKIVFEKNEGLQKGKPNRNKVTSRPKRRMNSLQELDKISGNVKSLPIENDFETVSNATKIKAEKVQ